ncbi:GNAT family N-acetyltransferase [Pseudomonas sp. F1_0610]|uniref:GNAT family N-acetyltransferase n=1 Tax=Pseudomonas sp. F1_0610 TaxID=3114284 RepID=UPI0039C250AF
MTFTDDIVIETERMRLIPVHEGLKADIWHALTPEVTEFLPFDRAESIEATQGFIDYARSQLHKGEELTLAMTDKQTGQFIGCCGLHDISSELASLGLWLCAEAQGKGLGTEAIIGLIDFAKKQLKPSFLVYNVEKENTGSCRIAEKLGFSLHREWKQVKNEHKTRNMLELRRYLA